VPQYLGLANYIAKTIDGSINPKYWGTAGRVNKLTGISPFGKQHDLQSAQLMLGSKPRGY
jgi:hypothetical protein